MKLDHASVRTGRTRRDIVSALMNYIAKTGQFKVSVSGSVRYQKRIDDCRWNCFHIRLEQDEYDFFYDLKKVMKMSVSFVISWAIENFLDKFLIKVTIGNDNYRYMNYAMYNVIIGDVFHIILCWGIPPRLIADS